MSLRDVPIPCPRCGRYHTRLNEGMLCDECLAAFRKAVEEDQKNQEAITKVIDALTDKKE